MCVKRSVAKTAAASVDGDDRAEQDRLEPGEVEERVGGDAGQERADDDADGAEQRRGHGDLPQPPPRGLQPALVEDQREPDDPDLARELRVVELDPARPVRAEQHPEREERDEHRQPRPGRSERQDDARGQDRADEQENQAFVHEDILSGGTHGRRVEHCRHGHAPTHAQDRPSLRDRAGRGPPRLRLLLRPAQADGHPSLDVTRRGRRVGGRIGAGPAPARDARRARADVRQVRPAALHAARRRPAGHRGRAAEPPGRRPPVPLRAGSRRRRGRARTDARAGVRPLRRGADRRRLDRSSAPCGAPERRRGRRQGAAPERATPDRVGPGAALPGGTHDQGARPRARLHRRASARGRVRTFHPAGARLQARGAPRRHVPAQLRRLRARRRAEGLLGLLGRADAHARIPRGRPTRRPRPRRDLPERAARARLPGDGDLDGDDLPARVLPRRPASSERARPRWGSDRPRRLRARREADRRGYGAVDAPLHRRRDRERRRAADAGSPSSASAIPRSARRSSAPSCATSTTATSARAWPRSTRSR